jgi:hypothetical protein
MAYNDLRHKQKFVKIGQTIDAEIKEHKHAYICTQRQHTVTAKPYFFTLRKKSKQGATIKVSGYK